MKSFLFTLLFVSFCLSTRAQILPVDSTTKLITYTAVMHTDTSLSATELYKRAKTWFALSFNDRISAIQVEEQEEGRFIAKGGLKVKVTSRFLGTNADAGFVQFTLVMQFKKGKYRYAFTRFYHEANGTKSESGGALENVSPQCNGIYIKYEQWQAIKKQVDDQVNALIISLNSAMAKPAAKSDW